MANLPLKCTNCNLQFTLKSEDETAQYFIKKYGTIDKVQGRVFEINCPLCTGVLEKQEEGQDAK